MIYKLLTALKYSGAIVTLIAIAFPVRVNSTEYVFSAPPEVGEETVEIPIQETDYPFYECDREISEAEAESIPEESEQNKIDSHNCDCEDCGEMTQNGVESEPEL